MPVLLISGLVAGWFVFQGWLAGDLTVGLYGGKSFNAGVGNGTPRDFRYDKFLGWLIPQSIILFVTIE